ncbi:hypothetical protein FOZ60_015048 [Perkinsus olseni]|uniref:Uncharacterized protein n=1 Tax=Perkinsus olseni TaxID=32597 RepID=A0A7J6N6A3_PEROL|nr:hypothetical protein FOZ60_015048 [Perkinsus olseni]
MLIIRDCLLSRGCLLFAFTLRPFRVLSQYGWGRRLRFAIVEAREEWPAEDCFTTSRRNETCRGWPNGTDNSLKIARDPLKVGKVTKLPSLLIRLRTFTADSAVPRISPSLRVQVTHQALTSADEVKASHPGIDIMRRRWVTIDMTSSIHLVDTSTTSGDDLSSTGMTKENVTFPLDRGGISSPLSPEHEHTTNYEADWRCRQFHTLSNREF